MAQNLVFTFLVALALAQTTTALGAEKTRSGSASMEQSRKITVKYKGTTNVDFSDTLVEGSPKDPFFKMIDSRNQDFNKGFIKIRYDWHDALIMSASGLAQ